LLEVAAIAELPHAAMADFPNAMRWAWRGYKTPP
jgi:hypothetical protein